MTYEYGSYTGFEELTVYNLQVNKSCVFLLLYIRTQQFSCWNFCGFVLENLILVVCEIKVHTHPNFSSFFLFFKKNRKNVNYW